MKNKSLLTAIALMASMSLLETSCGKKKSDDEEAKTPTTLTVDPTEAQALISKNCAGCHTGEKAKAGVVLDTLESAKKHAAKAAEEIEEGSMPPAKAKQQPTTEEKAKLLAWFTANK